MPTITDVQVTLQNLLNRTITQVELGKALGTGRANINDKIKKNRQLRPEEITKINDYFKVDLYKVFSDTGITQNDVLDFFRNKYTLSDEQIETLNTFFDRPEIVNALFIFLGVIKGDKSSFDVMEMIYKNPDTLKVMYGGKE